MKTLSSEIMRYNTLSKPTKKLNESVSGDEVEVFMNTWNNYNTYGADEGTTPTGWMSPEEALEYCEKYAEFEPFINDVENCPFEVSEYDNAPSKLEEIIRYNEYEDKELLKNAMETGQYETVDEYIDILERGDYIWFPGVESDDDLGRAYVDMCGGINEAVGQDRISEFFDADRYKDDIEYDERLYFAEENGIDVDDEDFPEDEFEEWLDAIVDDRAHNFADGDDGYFDYDALGSELSYDYTYTTDGAICFL